MLRKYCKSRKHICLVFFLCLTLLFGMGIGYLTNHVWSENGKFEKFTEEIFQKEVTGSTLTLHYSLANPEKQGIVRPSPGLGKIQGNKEEVNALYAKYENRLKEFSYQKLSKENQLTFDMLLLYFHTQRTLGKKNLLEEPLSPSLGIQAQLPVLLAEYAFYEKQDIVDYLKLLSEIQPYFQSILEFEKEKAEAGLFMSDRTLERILQQCQSFVKNSDSNYMQEIFAKKIKDYKGISQKEREKLEVCHKKILKDRVIPAYEELMAGLKDLKGMGKPSTGLAHFPGGRQYYLYLLQSQVGTYVPVEKIEQRMYRQLMEDSRMIHLMVKEQPSLITKLGDRSLFPQMEPQEMLSILCKAMEEEFPKLEEPEYQVRYVHDSMEKFLSPAFYLTPPLDTGNPNIIYINKGGKPSGLELFTTLAHEGFPGHLYQTNMFGQSRPDHIRYLFQSSGYVEGWATYIESYAYAYAAEYISDPAALDITRLAWLNRSANLCLYSLMDIGIHYRGWNFGQTADFLRNFGITDRKIAEEIFQYIVETPANYLKYYWGYLNFKDLKTNFQKKMGAAFELKEFHKKILEIGPVPFPVLEKYLRQEF